MNAAGVSVKSSKKNEIITDGVIKEQIAMEESTSNAWSLKWGFMKDFDKFCVEAAANLGITEEEYRRMTRKKRNGKLTEMGEFERNYKPSGPVPITSSGFIGWRSKIPNVSSEMFGPLYVSPKHTIDPRGEEKLPITRIILG